MPILAPVVFDQKLSNFSQAFFQDLTDFSFTNAFPITWTEKSSIKYAIYNQGDMNRMQDTLITPESRPKKIQQGKKIKTAHLDQHALMTVSAYKDIHNEDSTISKTLVDDLNSVNSSLATGLENNFIKKFFSDEAGWKVKLGGSTSKGTSKFVKWSDSSSTPILDIQEAVNKIRSIYNVANSELRLTVSRDVYTTLLNHSTIIGKISGGNTASSPAVVTRAVLANVLGVDKILILQSIQTTDADKPDNSSASSDFISKGSALLTFYIPSSVNSKATVAARTFAWSYPGSKITSTQMSNSSLPVLSRYIQNTNAMLMEVESHIFYTQEIIAEDLGVLFHTAL